jgi:hypothetical protein
MALALAQAREAEALPNGVATGAAGVAGDAAELVSHE